MVTLFDRPEAVEFGRFRVVPHRRQLFADGRPIALGGRTFDLLMTLIEASGDVVSKDQLLSRVWPDRIVEENRLQGEISALRKAFGADRELIRTVSGRGYQFTGETRILAAGTDARAGVEFTATAPGAVLPPTNLPEPVSELIGREDELGDLLGRDEEIDLLLRRWARAKAGDGRIILVSDEAGLGKSRITAAFEERLHAEPHLRLRYFCSPCHQDSALFPVIDQLGRAAGFARDDPPASKLDKLEVLLARAAPPDEDVAFLADLMSLPASERHPLPNLNPQQKKERTLEALIRQLEGLAHEQPVVAVWEDAHWLDPTSRELLDLTVERVRNLPVLLIVTFRPEFQPPWAGQPQVTLLALNRLDRRDHTRRLAAFLAAGVAGYLRLMGADEERTLAALKAIRREFGDPKIADHRGRIVKTTGDGLLVEFPSVVDAVRCAVEVQEGMAARNAEVPADRIEFRIGINLGDIIIDEDDIYGDGVNIAARLEALAEPGGICVSGTVRDHIGDQLPYAFEDMGEQSVKNIVRPVRAYAVRPEGFAAPAHSGLSSWPSWLGRIIVGMATAATLIIVCLVWWLWPASNFFSRAGKPADQATGSIMSAATTPTAAAISAPLVAPRLSIVVLPFANLSNDPDQQYFADGITENLTTDLSRLSFAGPMFVISSNSAFTYQGKRVDTKQIGRELGVRYVLQGSVERSGNRVRLNAQLIDAETDADLWAERFDGDTSDLFALQDEVTRRIAISLKLELIATEANRPTRNPDALDLVLRARSIYLRPMSRNRDDEIIGLLQRAVEFDPGFVEAQFRLAGALANRQLDGFDTSVADIKEAEALSLQALAAAPRNPIAHSARAQVLRAQGRLDEAIFEYEIALASDRNNVVALANMGRCRIFIGPIEDGISAQQQAIRLSPAIRTSDSGISESGRRVFCSHVSKRQKARIALPELAAHHAYLAAAYALHGDAKQPRPSLPKHSD